MNLSQTIKMVKEETHQLYGFQNAIIFNMAEFMEFRDLSPVGLSTVRRNT